MSRKNVVRFRDYEPLPSKGPPPCRPAQVIILPVVRIERRDRQPGARGREMEAKLRARFLELTKARQGGPRRKLPPVIPPEPRLPPK